MLGGVLMVTKKFNMTEVIELMKIEKCNVELDPYGDNIDGSMVYKPVFDLALRFENNVTYHLDYTQAEELIAKFANIINEGMCQ
jgi:hypothetical protein